MTDITRLKESYVEVESYEDAQTMANDGYVQLIMSNVKGTTYRVMAPTNLFADHDDQVAQGIEFATWYTNEFQPDTSKVVPNYPIQEPVQAEPEIPPVPEVSTVVDTL